MGTIISMDTGETIEAKSAEPIVDPKEARKAEEAKITQEIQEVFGSRLRKVVESSGKTVAQISDALNITPPTIYRYMDGIKNAGIVPIVKIARYFNISIDWLLGMSGGKFDPYPEEVQEIASLYSCASEADKMVVHAILDKYDK